MRGLEAPWGRCRRFEHTIETNRVRLETYSDARMSEGEFQLYCSAVASKLSALCRDMLIPGQPGQMSVRVWPRMDGVSITGARYGHELSYWHGINDLQTLSTYIHSSEKVQGGVYTAKWTIPTSHVLRKYWKHISTPMSKTWDQLPAMLNFGSLDQLAEICVHEISL